MMHWQKGNLLEISLVSLETNKHLPSNPKHPSTYNLCNKYCAVRSVFTVSFGTHRLSGDMSEISMAAYRPST